MKTTIFDIEIPANTFADIKKWVGDALKGEGQLFVAKAPSEFLVRAQENPEFKEALKEADLLISDGIGVLWAAKYLSLPLTKTPILKQLQAIWQMIYSGAALVFNHNYAKDVLPERLSGVEAMFTMLSAAEEVGGRVYFFGSRKEVLEGSVEVIKERFPKLVIAGTHDGYDFNDDEVIKDINKSGAALLIVALGSPKQEFWIRDNLSKLKTVKVAVGEGGSFDAVSGHTKRAPKFMQKIGLEWLWRGLFAPNLTTEHHRMRRVWNAVPVFIARVVKYKLETK